MELFTAINMRQSCRDFLDEGIEKEDIEKIIQAGIMAPSPLNSQPWDFIVITNKNVKEQIWHGVEKCKANIAETSGWKWLDKYSVKFLQTTPVIIVVTGDKTKSGADVFQEGGPVAYQHACAAAVQNMLLASHSLNLGSVWFTLFDKKAVKEILNIDDNKVPLAFVCLGKSAKESVKTARKPITKKTLFID
ncbi:MAG: nitroreductase family protein [Desulfobacteraceae bacterium]|nr:nitroreductase family protein [Desulfobacteraceae bacterium]